MLAPLAFVLFFSFRMQSMSAAGAQGMLWAFCAVMSLSMASIFLVFGLDDVIPISLNMASTSTNKEGEEPSEEGEEPREEGRARARSPSL